MSNFQGLGRGLGSLIPGAGNNSVSVNGIKGKEVAEIPLEQIEANSRQPRAKIERHELEDLMNSIKEHGILQPVLVTPTKSGYQLIAGERRFQSAKILGMKTIPAIVRPVDELEKLELALIENVQRQDLNALDRARAYQQLVDEFGLTQEEVAKKIGFSRSQITNTLRLLTLPAEVQQAIAEHKITEGHAKALLALDSPAEQIAYLKKIVVNELSVRDVEMQVRQIQSRTKARRPSTDPEVAQHEQAIADVLGTKVKIRRRAGRGQLTIEFYSDEEYKALIDKLTK
ncbi:MAG: ParB/RepB/Spo0J family partition protein [Patescibacteria group bacterium]|jgi:ParB family chromosome partitioning protein